MLSKSKGQILRVSAMLHVLFHIDTPLNIPETISENTVKAADNFVDLCLQHAAFLAVRGEIQDAVDDILGGTCYSCTMASFVYGDCTSEGFDVLPRAKPEEVHHDWSSTAH